MQHTFHCHLSKSFQWYRNWHKHPQHSHVHWSILVIILTLIISAAIPNSSQDINFKKNLVHAQTGPVLGISGDRFTVNGTSQFLLFISYFDAMEASNTTLDSDFARLQQLGFNGIRIFPNWPFGAGNQILMDSAGNLRSGMLSRLINIVQKAQSHNLIVDISFNRESISGLNVSEFRNGIVSTAQGLIPYRNIYFDLQNEADHDGTTCGTARLCVAEAKQIRDAVKAVDSQRIISVSTQGNLSSYITSGAMDFSLNHGPFSTLSGTQAFVARQRSDLPGYAIHAQEPDRCRSNPCSYTANQFINAAKDAKCAGAAGWNFHTAGGYNLSSSNTLFTSWLDSSVENAVANGLSSGLASTGWFSCVGGGNPTPTPSPTPTPISGGGPPYGNQGKCPAGFIMLGEANASSGDPAGTSGYYCDSDSDFARGSNPSVTQLVYPVTARLYCGSVGNGTAFAIDDSSKLPCNCRGPSDGIPSTCDYDPSLPFGQYTNSPGWTFSGGNPSYRGSSVRLVATHDCNVAGYTTFTATSGHDYGAWTQNPSRQGYACIPGTDLSLVPTPTPIPSPVIYNIYPYQVQNGGTLLISGQYLTNSIEIISSNGASSVFTGTLNGSATEILLLLPSLTTGNYTLRVGSSPSVSNTLPFQVIPGNFVQNTSATTAPFINLIYPTVIPQGSSFQIIGYFLTPNVQFFGTNNTPINVTGVVSNDLTTVTVSVPFSLSPGIYTIGITGPFGSTIASDIVTIQEGEVPSPGSQSIPLPSAQSFETLISSAFNYAVMFVGIAVFIMILYAGFLWLTSAANPGNIARAKSMILNAILGGILLLSAYVILYTINPELVGGGFSLPGIVTTPSGGQPPSGGNNCNNPQALAQQYNAIYPRQNASELDALISCVLNDPIAGPMIDQNQLYTYEQTNDLCNYTRGRNVCGACQHSVDSCHYGGATGTQGSYGIDFNSINGGSSAENSLYNALQNLQSTCNFGYILFENTHTHVSSLSCSGN